MEHEAEILALLEQQVELLRDISRSLDSVGVKLDDIEGSIQSATGFGTETLGDIKSAINDVTLELANVTLAIESSS